MGLFSKKENSLTPPDIGREELDSLDSQDVSVNVQNKPVEFPKVEKPVPKTEESTFSEGNNLDAQRLEGKIDSVVQWINQFYERFSMISESIGELRAMSVANEKKISGGLLEAEKAIDMVKEVQPEKLRVDYQKLDNKILFIEQKLEATNLLFNSLMEEIRDLRRKSEIFVGTDALMQLNSDTKKEMIEIQKISVMSRMYADKSEQLFLELKKGMAESEKAIALVRNSEAVIGDIRKELEKLKINIKDIADKDDLNSLKGEIFASTKQQESRLEKLERLGDKIEEITKMSELSLSVSESNEEKVDEMVAGLGKDGARLLKANQTKFNELLEVVQDLSYQVKLIKGKLGIGKKEIKANKKTK
jgi:archaellum component FlaC